MSVVGYDFGNESCIIAVARAGGIETIDNDYSLRATPSYVAFGEKQRMLGVSAKNQTVTNVKNTIHGFKRLLGRKFNDPVVQAELNRVPFQIVPTANGGTGVKVQYLRNTCVFTMEQITAMLFTKLRETAEHHLQNAQNCVISVPSYYTVAQRQALIDAATMAGLNVHRLLNESSATALNYGIYKQDLPGEEESPRNVVFIDCGHSALQVFACAFNKGKLKMLACTSDPFLGGRDFDEVLANYFCDDFKKKYGIDARNNPRAYIRLLTEVDKIKKNMSANTTPLPLNIECFMDKDVSSSICRADFEEMAQPLLARVAKTLQKCLCDSKLTPAEIHSVEIVGGSTRTPAIKQLIEQTFGYVPSTTLNQDEAIARGCALQCAILSPTFKVREFSVTDVQPYPIKLKFDEPDGSVGDMDLFPQYHPFPFAKMVTFHRKSQFDMTAYYSTDIPFPDPTIATFKIRDVKPSASGESCKVKVKLRMNINGILEASSATSYEKLEETQSQEPMEIGNEECPEEDQQNCQANGEVKADAGATENNEKKSEDEKKPETDEKKSVKVKKPQFKTIDLNFETLSYALPRHELNDYVEQEGKMVADDRQEKERIDVKNALEEYIYDIREKLESSLQDFVKENDRSEYLKTLNYEENWLYDEGTEQMKNVYAQKLEELKKFGEPIKMRKREFEEAPAALDQLSVSLSRVRKVLEARKNNDEAFSHLQNSEIETLEKELKSTTDWFETSWRGFQASNKYECGPVSVKEIQKKIESFEKVTAPIITKPKPKVQPPKNDNNINKDKPEGNVNVSGEPKSEADNIPDGGVKMDIDGEVD